MKKESTPYHNTKNVVIDLATGFYQQILHEEKYRTNYCGAGVRMAGMTYSITKRAEKSAPAND